MRTLRSLIAFVVLLSVPGSVGAIGNGGGRPQPVCPADVAATLAERCPCDGQATHGRHVSCVAHFRRDLRKAGCLGREAWRPLVCAARSTCGKQGAVLCCLSRTGTCDDPVPGDLNAEGSCSNDRETRCDTDADCVKTSARVARDDAQCVAAGGAVAGTGSVCDACTTSTTTTTSTSTSTTTTSTTSTTATTTTTTLPPGSTYGNAAEFPAASAHSPNYLLGSAVAVPGPRTLTHLGVIAKAGGPRVVLTLYSSRAGAPDQLIAATPPTPMSIGINEIPVTPTPLATATYWIMGVYDTDASIGMDANDPAAVVSYIGQPFASPLPDPIGLTSSYSGQKFNYYIRVLE